MKPDAELRIEEGFKKRKKSYGAGDYPP